MLINNKYSLNKKKKQKLHFITFFTFILMKKKVNIENAVRSKY
jgi:hypothetical protein